MLPNNVKHGFWQKEKSLFYTAKLYHNLFKKSKTVAGLPMKRASFWYINKNNTTNIVGPIYICSESLVRAPGNRLRLMMNIYVIGTYRKLWELR